MSNPLNRIGASSASSSSPASRTAGTASTATASSTSRPRRSRYHQIDTTSISDDEEYEMEENLNMGEQYRRHYEQDARNKNKSSSSATAPLLASSSDVKSSSELLSNEKYQTLPVKYVDEEEEDDEEQQQQKPQIPPRVNATASTTKTESSVPSETKSSSTRVEVPVNSNASSTASSTTTTAANQEGHFINVKTVDDRTYKIYFRQNSLTLREFRALVEQATNVPIQQQKLICNGRLLGVEDSMMDLPTGSFVHLVVAISGTSNPDGSNDDSSNEDEFDYMSETVVQRQMGNLHALAWVIVVVFLLIGWKLLMTLMFDDSPEHEPFHVNFARFLLAVFGIFVGWYGINVVGSYRTLPSQAVQRKVRIYVLLLTALAMGYLLSTLQEVDYDKNSFFGIMLIQSTFWYCILQAQMTHRALVLTSPSSSSTSAAQQPATVSSATAAVSMIPSMTSFLPQPSNNNNPSANTASNNPAADQPGQEHAGAVEMRPIPTAIAHPVAGVVHRDVEAQQDVVVDATVVDSTPVLGASSSNGGRSTKVTI